MIFLTYGLPKSASTFVFLLAKYSSEYINQNISNTTVQTDEYRLLCETSGLSRPRLGQYFIAGSLDPIVKSLEENYPRATLSLKTHSVLTEQTIFAAQKKLIVPIVSYRNLGDAAVSAFDAGEAARAKNDLDDFFITIESRRQAIDFIGRHFAHVTVPWIQNFPNNSFSFSQITNYPEQILKICANALSVDIGELLSYGPISNLIQGKERAYNFNRGEVGRHQTELGQSDLNYLKLKYGRLLEISDCIEGKGI